MKLQTCMPSMTERIQMEKSNHFAVGGGMVASFQTGQIVELRDTVYGRRFHFILEEKGVNARNPLLSATSQCCLYPKSCSHLYHLSFIVTFFTIKKLLTAIFVASKSSFLPIAPRGESFSPLQYLLNTLFEQSIYLVFRSVYICRQQVA